MGKADKCRAPPATHSNECSSVSDSTEEIRASILGEEEKHEKIEFDCSSSFFFGKIISSVYLILMPKKSSKLIADCWTCMCNETKLTLCSWTPLIRT